MRLTMQTGEKQSRQMKIRAFHSLGHSLGLAAENSVVVTGSDNSFLQNHQ